MHQPTTGGNLVPKAKKVEPVSILATISFLLDVVSYKVYIQT